MYQDQKIRIAESDKNLYLLPQMANRHGLIAGATGTGKTTTLKVLAESFSDMGVPVFLSDVKGDLSGMCQGGSKSYPTRFWDIFGEQGHPVRITISDMGPLLLARLLGLTEIQAGVLNIVFRIADENGLLLLDLKDLRAMVQYVGDNRAEFTTIYGNISSATIGAIQRALLTLEDAGGTQLFGEPALDIRDWIRTDIDGRGYINLLYSARLIQSPETYSSFLLWMLSELFEILPEIGDPEKPRMVFFFDEAHLIFSDISKALLQKIIQAVKLIRSKGVGIYFISQSPSDIPDEVLSQLSNRIQHALRAYTPAEQKALRAAAAAFRQNPSFNTAKVLMELGVGEALISCLDENGIPQVVERGKVLLPESRMGPADPFLVQNLIAADEFDLKYREVIDRESAYEIIDRARQELEAARIQEAEEAAAEKQRLKEEAAAEKQRLKEEAAAEKQRLKEEAAAQKAQEKKAAAQKKVLERAATNAASSVARSLSTNMINSVTGGRKTSTETIVKRAASTALSSVMRSGSTSIVRGLFGNKK